MRNWGTGSVTREGDGWRARMPLAFGRRSLGVVPTKREAQELLTAAIELEASQPSVPRTVNDAAAEYLARPDIRENTRARDRRRWADYAEHSLGALPLHTLIPADVSTWWRQVRRRSLSAQTCANLAGIVRGALKGHAIPELPLPSRDRTTDEWTWLREHEIARALGCQAVPLRDRLAWAVAIFTGLRAGELWGLRWDDVDFGRGVLTVRHSRATPTKSGKPREVALLWPAFVALERMREVPLLGRNDLGLVFPSRTGGIFADGFDAGWYDSRKRFRFGRPVRFHDLRHTCASHLLQGTWAPAYIARAMRLEEVRDVLGHSDIKITQRYAHLCTDSRHALVHRLDGGSGRVGSHTGELNPGPTVYEGMGGRARLRLILGDGAPPSTSPARAALEEYVRTGELPVRLTVEALAQMVEAEAAEAESASLAPPRTGAR